LKEPVQKQLELRDLAVLKLFFSEVMTTDELVDLARNQEELHRERLAVYEQIESHYRDRPGLARRMAPLSIVLLIERDSIQFWSSIAECPLVRRLWKKWIYRKRTSDRKIGMVQDAIPMTVPAFRPSLAETLESSHPPGVFLMQHAEIVDACSSIPKILPESFTTGALTTRS
jgi:hypothetical protein